ncbi:MAG TPA: LCP family protein, partial [Ktedonobacterales bacterium]|nr:LCP family protein [Ktedonobacterales bacterium]
MNDNQHPWYDRNGEPKRRTSGPGDERREPGRPSRPDNPGQGTPRPRSGAPSQDANQFANASKSGGQFKGPFLNRPPTAPRRPPSEPAPYESLDNNPIDDAGEQGFAPRREQREGPPDSGMRSPRRRISRPPEDTPEREFEDLDESPRPRKRSRPPNDERPPSRRRSRPQEGDRGPAGELPIPSSRASRRPRALILKGVLAFFLLMTCSSGSIVFLKIYHYYTFAQGATSKALPTLTANTGGKGPQATPLPTDLTSLDHFNMLLLGSDNDTKFPSGAVLTQTDIVVRVDIKNRKITMVSIPRDFYIRSDLGGCCVKLDEISGGETDGASTPLDAKLHGFAHTVATIEDDFGIPISAYAWVGLDGFVKVIDTLGGVDVDVLHPIVDDAYPNDVGTGDPYAYKRLDIPAGPQHLDGLTALEYVRSRHSDLTGDFGRSARQQSLLLALKKKLEDPAVFTKLDQFADDLQGSVLTSLSIGQVL